MRISIGLEELHPEQAISQVIIANRDNINAVYAVKGKSSNIAFVITLANDEEVAKLLAAIQEAERTFLQPPDDG